MSCEYFDFVMVIVCHKFDPEFCVTWHEILRVQQLEAEASLTSQTLDQARGFVLQGLYCHSYQ